ncbi:galactokinase [Nocardioides sambongensis]|uniref:galactokinase n=1 Tax=Nocardioides sambongensis TaxID=2589074 RepID=UPI0015E86B97|nr:galactokinase [Nocardioides sambongensis]
MSATEVTAFAPGRVNLIGEHTDYNGGLALPFALPMGTTVTARRGDAEVFRARSREAGDWVGTGDDIRGRSVTGWASYLAGVVWALEESGHRVGGCDLEITSDVPLGAGLSSSASLECAVALALLGLAGESEVERREVAEICRRAETEYVGAPTGGLDQTAVMLADAEHGVLIDFAAHTAAPVPLPLAAAGLAVLVTDTRVTHALADGTGYGDRRTECRRASEALGVASLHEVTAADLDRLDDDVLLRRARHVVTENDRVRRAAALVQDDDWQGLGGVLSASHASLRDDFEVTVPALDLAAATAERYGALGARMTGGGFGGSTIALVDEGRVDAVRDGVDAAFAEAGLRAPAHHLVRPSAGARRLT